MNIKDYGSSIPLSNGPCRLCSKTNSYKISSDHPHFSDIIPGIPNYGHPLTTNLCSDHFYWLMSGITEGLQVYFPFADVDDEKTSLEKLKINYADQAKDLKPGLVIGRLTAFGDYKSLYDALHLIGIKLINSPEEFNYIRSFNYYEDIKDLTMETWDYNKFQECDYNGPFVVRGKWASVKWNWQEMMFAKDKTEVHKVAGRLNYDSIIGKTGIIVRKYIPLKQIEVGINGLPFSNEYRFFCYKDKILSWGFNFQQICDHAGLGVSHSMFDLVQQVINRVSDKCTYYTVDVAEKESGGWIVIELNEGQCSGLSGNNPETVYGELYRVLHGKVN